MSLFNSKPGERESRSSRLSDASSSPFERTALSTATAEEEPMAEESAPETYAPAPISPFTDRTMAEPKIGLTTAEQCANVIAAGSKWTGSLNIGDSVRIEGEVSGQIVAKGTIHISEGARVEAKIEAAFVVISGSFKGEVRATERLELMPTSRIEGELVTKVLNVHEGALVDGTIQMQHDKPREERSSLRSSKANAS